MSATSIIQAWKTIHTEYILEYIQRISREGSGQGISREYHVKEVDKAKGINSNSNSKSYCSQDNY